MATMLTKLAATAASIVLFGAVMFFAADYAADEQLARYQLAAMTQ